MDRILSQAEIDAIVNATIRGKTPDLTAERQRVVQNANFRAAGQLSNEHARTISALHEGFARDVGHSLGAYLRVGFTMTLSSLEQITFREYIGGIAEGSYVVPVHLHPLEITGLMQMDLALVFPIIDVLLGGPGGAITSPKEMTEIDEDIMGSVSRIICNQLQKTWEALEVEVLLEKCLKLAQAQQIMQSTEKVLLLTFEIAMAGTNGALHMVFPAAFANAIVRKASTGDRGRKARVRYLPGPPLRERLLVAEFDTTIGLSPLRMKVRDLISLVPGDVLPLPIEINKPASLLVGGRGLFEAAPVRSGNKRAAQLLQAIPTIKRSQEQQQ